MYNYFINFQPLLLGAPLPLGALSVRLVRLWINPTLQQVYMLYCMKCNNILYSEVKWKRTRPGSYIQTYLHSHIIAKSFNSMLNLDSHSGSCLLVSCLKRAIIYILKAVGCAEEDNTVK